MTQPIFSIETESGHIRELDDWLESLPCYTLSEMTGDAKRGERVRFLLDHYAVTVEQTAEDIGAKVSTVESWLAGESLSERHLKLMCCRFGVSPAWLRDGIPQRRPGAELAYARVTSLDFAEYVPLWKPAKDRFRAQIIPFPTSRSRD